MHTKITINALKNKKNVEKITAITSYDALSASIFDGEVDVILVGDSLNMSFNGEEDTLSLSIESMLYHTKAVRKKIKSSFLIADMTFGSYVDSKTAIKNALRLYKEGGADCVKLEGEENKINVVRDLANEGILTMSHIGLMPQFVRNDGGYKIKGKLSDEEKRLVDVALKMEDAGACMILLEGTKGICAREITKAVKVPVIGIGSGVDCDGQILVWSDAFGFYTDFKPKFVRRYMEGADLLKKAVRQYAADIKSKSFPNEDESY